MNLEEVKTAISTLTPAELDELYEWLDQHQSLLFDARIEADVAAGRLNGLISRALEDHREGRTAPL